MGKLNITGQLQVKNYRDGCWNVEMKFPGEDSFKTVCLEGGLGEITFNVESLEGLASSIKFSDFSKLTITEEINIQQD